MADVHTTGTKMLGVSFSIHNRWDEVSLKSQVDVKNLMMELCLILILTMYFMCAKNYCWVNTKNLNKFSALVEFLHWTLHWCHNDITDGCSFVAWISSLNSPHDLEEREIGIDAWIIMLPVIFMSGYIWSCEIRGITMHHCVFILHIWMFSKLLIQCCLKASCCMHILGSGILQCNKVLIWSALKLWLLKIIATFYASITMKEPR